jgi:hypothetical protein
MRAIADLQEAYQLLANAWSELPEGDRVGRGYLEQTMARIVSSVRSIVIRYDLPEEMMI